MSDVLNLLRQSLESNPSDWNVRKAIVEQAVTEGDMAVVSDVIGSCPGSVPDPETALRFSQLVRESDPGLAMGLIEGGLSTNASNGSLHFAKAELLLDSGDVQNAGTHYSVAKTFDSGLQNPEFEKRLGEMAISASAVPAAAAVAVEPEIPAVEVPVEQVAAVIEEAPREPVALEEAPDAYAAPAVEPGYVEGDAVYEAVTPLEEEPVAEEIPAEVHHPVALNELPTLRPLVDPNSVPATPHLNTGHVDVAAPALNFTPQEQLMETRSHLAVFGAGGAKFDADALEDDAWYGGEHEEPALLVAGEGSRPVASQRDQTQEKVGAVLTTILVHVAIALLLWVLVISIPDAKPPEIVATTMAPTNEKTVTKKQIARQVQQKPSAPSQNVAQIITAATSAPISAPTVDFAPETDSVELGTSFGIGMGFGAGGSGAGGTFSFMGNSGSGNRVVFAVDYSASMKSGGREALMKEELAKSVMRLPRGSQYQVVFFSGFAWPHDAVKDEWLKNKGAWGDKNSGLLNKMRPFGSSGRLRGKAEDITIPKYSYLEASKSNLVRSKEIIEEMPLTYGTNWEHPVIMALSIRPKPDIIFFMTDGAVGDPTKAINAITELNKKGKPAVINTTAMMEPKAARELSTLADKNGGKFSIVMKDGKVVKGEDYFKK